VSDNDRARFLQRIRSTVDERCQKQMINELDIVVRENACPYIVQFYGALFKEVSRTVPRRRHVAFVRSVQGRLLDLHGTIGHVARSFLQVRLS
jgi:ribosomal protein L35AE/L33A